MASLFGDAPAKPMRPIAARGRLDEATLRAYGCKVCPLKTEPGRMDPTGPADAPLYFLGEAPGKTEIEEGKQFVGDSGRLLREHLPRGASKHIRWNNVVNSRPPGNRTPEATEISCCAPRVEGDIAATKPLAIVGFGNVPLEWVSGFSGVTLWRGRRMPVRVGGHACWYYPMLHPSYLLRNRRREGAWSEEERMFDHDMRRIFDELPDLVDADPHTPARARSNVELITAGGEEGLDQIRQALQWAAAQDVIGLDYETNCLRPYAPGAKILTVSVGTADKAYAWPIRHREAPWSDRELDRLDGLWRRFILRGRCAKTVHNLAFELEWTAHFYGADLIRAGRWEDTANQAAVLDERRGKNKPGCFSLEFLVQQYFGINLKQLSGVNRKKLDNTPLDTVLLYNGMDAKYHAGLWHAQQERIEQDELQEPYRLAVRRVPTVVAAQVRGVPVDQSVVHKLQDEYTEKLQGVEDELRALPITDKFRSRTGRPFNPLSNKDVLYLMQDMLGRDEVRIAERYSDEYRYSVDEKVLSQIDHPIAELLLRIRKFTKRKSTYIDPLDIEYKDSVVFPDGLLHTQFNTFFAETGRLSSEEPNLQNFPKRDDEAKVVRRPIVAAKGCTILAFDYGQIEARVIAMFTKDKVFCKALWENYDVHMEWAERLAHAYPSRIGGRKMLKDKGAMKKFRTDVKNQWTFPLFFGARLESAAGYLKIPEAVIKPEYEEFWRIFSGVKDWQEQQLEHYREHGWVACLTGRRRHGPLSTNQVYNTPVQGTAAEIVMDGMCRLSESGDPDLQPEINIHDDLTFVRVPIESVDVVAEKVLDTMLAVPFEWVNVPITVEMSEGPNWMSLEDVGAFSSAEWFK